MLVLDLLVRIPHCQLCLFLILGNVSARMKNFLWKIAAQLIVVWNSCAGLAWAERKQQATRLSDCFFFKTDPDWMKVWKCWKVHFQQLVFTNCVAHISVQGCATERGFGLGWDWVSVSELDQRNVWLDEGHPCHAWVGYDGLNAPWLNFDQFPSPRAMGNATVTGQEGVATRSRGWHVLSICYFDWVCSSWALWLECFVRRVQLKQVSRTCLFRVAQQDYDAHGWRSNDWGPWPDDAHGYSSYSNRQSEPRDPGMRDAILKLLGCRKGMHRISWKEVVGLAVWNVLSLQLQVCSAVGLGPCCGRLPWEVATGRSRDQRFLPVKGPQKGLQSHQ